MRLLPIFLTLVVAATGVSGACAADPFSAVYDRSTRVQRVEYKENLVVQVAGYSNTPFFIEFNPDEPLGDVATPADAPYEVVKKGSRLFIRPLSTPREVTTILVTTKSRSYVIDLVGGAPQAFKDRVSKVVFSYPTATASSMLVGGPPASPSELHVASSTTTTAEASNGYRNDAYSMQVVSETVDIRPREAFDDGRFTWFKFPNNIEIPTIYKSQPGSGEEWLVSSHRDGEYIVMHGVAPLWNFRLGGSVLGIFNDSYEPEGVPPKRGTTVPGLERVVKQ
jgi:type IV secretion system protein VirB9